MIKQLGFSVLPVLLAMWLGSTLSAQSTLLDFEDLATGAQFENATIGTVSGPFIIDGIFGPKEVNFTTTSVTGFVDTSSFGLGVNSGGGDPDTESFNIGETWSISSDKRLFLEAFDIGGLQSEETFEIQSDAWIDLTDITPVAGVTYLSATGTFQLTESVPSDAFTASDLTGGQDLPFRVDVPVVFGNLQSTFGPNDDVELQSLTLSSVPEPSFAAIGLGSLLFVMRRRRDRASAPHLQKTTSE